MVWVYILRCRDGTFYVGLTTDIESRETEHNQGTGSRYTAARRPVKIIYTELHPSLESARARERQLKRWSAAKKEALATGALDVKDLSRCRSRSKDR